MHVWYVRTYVCMYVCMYVCTCVCMMYVRVLCMYVRNICMYVCDVCVYVCMYVHTYCMCRDVKNTDIQTLERRLMQTMDMIISKKKRSVLSSPCTTYTVHTYYRLRLL